MTDRRRPWRSALLLLLLLAVALALVGPAGLAFAADPTAPPATPTCRERYATPGPGGIDLRLACTANEVIGAFTNLRDPARTPTALVVIMVSAVVVGLLVVAVTFRLFRRQAGRRLASVTPAAWWVCPACRSFNAPTATACYACATPWMPDAAVAPTAPDPPAD